MSTTIEALTGGFSEPVHHAQSVFRMMMECLSRPGTIQSILPEIEPPKPMGAAAGAMALTLLDHDTPVWLTQGLAKSAAADWIAFHTGAPITREKSEARFAFAESGASFASFGLFALGSQEYPDRSTTIILEVAGLDKGPALTLSGPGIRDSATIAPLDLTDGDSIARLASAIAERWQQLDMLVLNAAMLGTLTPVAAIDGKEFNKLLTLNLIAQQALIANFDPLLRRAPNGCLIALSSSVAREPRAYWGAYAATKAALETLITSYGAEMRNISTVRTAILDPGGTRTQMRARAYPGEDPQSIKDPAAVGEFVAGLMVEGFDSTAFHALPKVMEKA